MNKITVFGGTKNKIFKIIEDNLKGIWNYNTELKSIDFVKEKGNYILEDDEIFFIKLSDDENNKIMDLFNTPNANNIKRKQLLEIGYIFVIDKNEIYFQRIFKSNLINKPFVTFKDTATLNKETILIIQDRTDVIFKNNKIYFVKFNDLTAIFKFLAHYYREATKEDLQQFKTCKYLNIYNDFDIEKLPKTALQKVAQIVDNLENLEQNFDIFKKYADEYVEIFKNSQIQISNKKDIDILHNLMFEKYYKSAIGSEKRVANSFKTI